MGTTYCAQQSYNTLGGNVAITGAGLKTVFHTVSIQIQECMHSYKIMHSYKNKRADHQR